MPEPAPWEPHGGLPEWAQVGYQGPTPSLAEYRKVEENDHNIFWYLAGGHHQNLLDEAMERLDELEAANQALRTQVETLRNRLRLVVHNREELAEEVRRIRSRDRLPSSALEAEEASIPPLST